MATNDQLRRYRAIWGKAIKVLAANGLSDEEIEEKRFEIHEAVCGDRRSSKELGNGQMTEVTARFQAIADPSDLQTQIDAQNHGRNTRVWWLERCNLPGSYLESVCEDKFGVRDWKNLGDRELYMFHMTIKNRAAVKA